MKKLIAIFSLFLFGSISYAQYNVVAYDSDCIAKIIQIDQYDESTVIFCSLTSRDAGESFSINDKIHIAVDGSYKKYKLISLGNVPLTSENCSAYIREKGNALNFIMEFEKVPLDKPFNIIENPDRSSALTFNFKNVTVNTASKSQKVDIDDFLAYTDYVKSGNYTKDGHSYRYYEVNGLSVATMLGEEYDDFVKVGILRVEIFNESGRPVKFSPSNIKVSATRNEKNGYKDLPVWDLSTYDSYVSSDNSLSVSSYSDRVSPVASDLRRYRNFMVSQTDLGSQVLLGTLETLFRSAGREEVDEYAAALEKNRQKLWNNYLQSVTVEDGESYGGFVSFKDQNFKLYLININVGGNVYTFRIKG